MSRAGTTRSSSKTTFTPSARTGPPPPSSISPRTYGFLVLSGVATGLSWLCYFRALQLGQASRVAPLDKLTDEDFAVSLANKLMGQVNLVRLGMKHINDGGSFTLTSGVLANEPVPGSAAISLVNAGWRGLSVLPPWNCRAEFVSTSSARRGSARR